MPRDLVELKKQVKAANDIADVIAGYVPVTTVGKAVKCLCPFHNDTRPSLQIDRKWQNFHCWACGAKGDVFTFVEKFEKVGFMEALSILARRAGIPTDDATASPQDTHKLRLFGVMAWAQKVYHDHLLESPDAQLARKYLGERQLAGATVRDFGLGFAPMSGDWLVSRAEQEGVPADWLVEVGLIAPRDENRGYYDRFRDRVLFPIRDMQGRTVAFGGRILPESPFAPRAPKYYNSPDTPLFSKSDVLFGLDKARHAASAAGVMAVVEGYTDVMMAHQCGITHVVATMGTALNARHVTQLRRYVPRVVLVFDADAGGNTGVDRALDIFVSQDAELAVATLPDGLDPADLLVTDGGVDVFRNVLTGAVDAVEFKLNQLLAKSDGGIEASRRMLDAILGIMALAPTVPSQSYQLKQDLILTRLAQRLGLDLKRVRDRFRELQRDRRRQEHREAASPQPLPMPSAARVTSPPSPVVKTAGPPPILERQLLQVLLAEPELVPQAATLVRPEEVTHSGLQRMILELYALLDQGGPADLDALRVRLLDRPDLAAVAMDLQQVGHGIPDRAVYFNKIIGGFAKRKADAETRALKEQLGGVAADDDTAAVELLRRLQNRAKGVG